MGPAFCLMTLSWFIGAPFVVAIFGLYAFIVRMWHVGRYNVFHWIDLYHQSLRLHQCFLYRLLVR